MSTTTEHRTSPTFLGLIGIAIAVAVGILLAFAVLHQQGYIDDGSAPTERGPQLQR